MAKSISALAVVAILLGLSSYVGAGKEQATTAKPGQAVQDKKPVPKLPQSRAEVMALLQESLDMNEISKHGETTLEEFLGVLYDAYKLRKLELPILVDTEAFKEEFPDAGDIYQTKVKFAKFPRSMSAATLLRLALAKVPTNNATYKIMRDHIEITTYNRAAPDNLLRLPILASFKNLTLAQVIHELSEITSAPIMIDERVGAKKEMKIAAAFYNDVSLQGALRVLTEQAGLSVVQMNSILFVTTPERAKELADEKKQYVDERLQFLKKLNEIPLGGDGGSFDFLPQELQQRWWMPAPPV